MRKFYIFVLALLLSATAFAQHKVGIGRYHFTPPANVQQLINSKSGLDKTTLANGRNYVLIQFDKLPTASERKSLSSKGVVLNDYLGGNAFFASMTEGNLADKLKKSTIRSVIPVKAEWKVSNIITNGKIPEWADAGNGMIKAVVSYNSAVKRAFVEKELNAKGFDSFKIQDMFRTININLTKNQAMELAKLPWVVSVNLIAAPMELFNVNGRAMGHVNILSAPASLNGRGLTGKGVKVGVWDSNVESHIDLGNRINQQEFESRDDHGMHVAGTVAGAGIIDPLAKGMAPKATIYSHNFGWQSNNNPAPYEMVLAKENFGISITQNSYGIPTDKVCHIYNDLAYDYFGGDFYLDLVAVYYPTLTHVFAAGNSQGACGKPYGTSTNRTKNVLHVGAVDKMDKISTFSSFGPTDDGRLLPTVSTMGVDVYSTIYGNEYKPMSGTSMACPTASGTIAVITERYMQLTNGSEPLSALMRALVANTADDKGRPQVDYIYGYGVINAEKAVKTIENSWYKIDKLKSGDAPKTYKIDVPAGMNPTNLRVMLVWTDTVAKKQYAYGEKALINDLDLTVNNILPWVLDAKNPGANATQGVDTLNNMEQVTISNPSGQYTVTVKPTTIVSSEQEYALVWYFDSPKLTLTYPNGGDLIAPGDNIVIRWGNTTKPVTVSLSYDNGATYTPIATNAKDGVLDFEIPQDATATNKALIKVFDGEQLDVSDFPFTIMGVPNNVQVETPECGVSGWNIKWEAVTGATSYDVLKANVAEATFETVANVTDVEFVIPEDKISTDKRNVFTVVAKKDDIVSRRAKGVLVKTSQPLPVNTLKLPFVETFKEYPSKYIKVNCGMGMEAVYAPQRPEFSNPAGSHTFAILPKNPFAAFDWDDNNPFATEMNNTKMTMCNVDLTKVKAGKKIILMFDMKVIYNDTKENSQARTFINGELVKNTAGDSIMMGQAKDMSVNTFHKVSYDLSKYVGQTASIKMEYVAKDGNNFLAIKNIKIFEAQDDIDIRVVSINTVEAGSDLGKENPVTLIVENNSAVTVKNVPVGYGINGKDIVFETIKEIKPFEQYAHTFYKKADFSTENSLGETFKVVAMTTYKTDANKNNNATEITVANFGKVVRMQPSGIGYVWGAPQPTDPRETITVNGSIIFTDNGSALYDYPNFQKSTVRFVPSDPNKVIQITFREFETQPGADGLFIFSDQLKDEFPLDEEPNYVLMGKIKSQPSFVSNSSDGSMVITFLADNEKPAKGWVADVREIIKTNTFTLALKEFEPYYENKEVPVIIGVKNHAPITMHDVKVAYRVDEGTWVQEIIPSVAAGDSITHEFKTKFTADSIKYYKVEAVISSPDADVSDNKKEAKIFNDKYCRNTSIQMKNGLYITKVKMYDYAINTPAGDNDIDYMTDSTITVYRDTPKELEVSTNAAYPGYSIALYIDWNNDGTYAEDATEQYKVDLMFAKDYKIPFTIPATATAGEYRMRLILGETAKVLPCVDELTLGDIQEYTIKLEDGTYYIQNDLALTNVQVKSGILTTTEDITVTVKNNSGKDISEFDIAYTINGKNEVKEKANLNIPAFGQADYTFTTKANLEEPNTYDINVYLTNNDENNSNDTISTQTFNVNTTKKGFYALNISGDYNKQEQIDLSTINNADLKNAATFEAWVNLNPSERNYIFYGKGISVFAYDKANSLYPENSYIIEIDEKLRLHSPANVVNRGKWQHIAVTVATGINYTTYQPTTEVKLYVDGQEYDLTKITDGLMPDNADKELLVAPFMNGMIDQVRVWNTTRVQADIETSMYETLRQADGSLPLGCLVEYSFDEGPGNPATLSGTDLASIKSERINAGDDCIWVKPNHIIAKAEFKNQAIPATKTADNTFKVTLQAGADLSSVEGAILTTYPGVELKYASLSQVSATTITKFDDFIQTSTPTAFDEMGGQLVTPTTTYDFTKGRLYFGAQLNIFGKTLNELIAIEVEEDKTADCELLTLKLEKSNNAGLTSDVELNPITATNTFKVDGIADKSNVKLTFTVSAGAKAMVKNAELTSGVTPVDFTQPVIITVLAANGRDSKDYVVYALSSQTITWDLAKTTYTYGDNPVDLTATSSSDLPITYVSDNNNIVTVANGKLMFAGVGTTSVKAIQTGNAEYDEATSIKFDITVNKKEVTVKPINVEVPYATEPVPQLAYEGLVNPADAREIGAVKYDVYKGGNTLWSPMMGYLPKGTHMWKPVNANMFETEKYKVTPQSVDFKVVDNPQAHKVVFVVTDGTNPIKEVGVVINKTLFVTNDQGKVELKLMPKYEEDDEGNIKRVPYKYIIIKDGYTQVRGIIDMKDADITEEIVIKALDITLTYLAGDNGTIAGMSTQQIPAGTNGRMVVASPDYAYEFDKWSDGRTDNPRMDTDVTKNIEVTATFKKIELTVNYIAGLGGVIEGETEQVVSLDGSTKSVTAKPNAGYVFDSWDDGNTNPVRKDENIDKSATHKAKFIYERKSYELPYVEKFNTAESLPADWQTDDVTGNGTWQFASSPIGGYKASVGDGVFAYVDSKAIGNKQVDASLASPWLDITNLTSNVDVEFDYFVNIAMINKLKSYFACYYRVDETSPWVELMKIDFNSPTHKKQSTYTGSIDKTNLVGATKLQFSWKVYNKWDYQTCLDNIKITANLSEYKLTYVATEGGTVNGKEVVNLTKKATDTPEAVTAIADDGYYFAKWSDGSTDNPRTDTKATFVKAIFKKGEKPEDYTGKLFTLIYESDVNGYINGLTWQPNIAGGSQGSPVTAVANKGFIFDKWSDESTDNPRTDIATKNITVKAMFKAIYPINFVVNDKANNPLKGASVKINNETLTTDAEGKASIELPNGDYAYTISLDGYIEQTASVTVQNAEQTVNVQLLLKTYPINFVVADKDNKPLSGVSITINNQTLTTDTEGKASIELPNGDYTYTISLDGYVEQTTSVTVQDAEQTVNVQLLLKTYPINFVVADKDNKPLAGASVKINNETLTTDAEGKASIKLENGTYDYTVSLDGYDEYTASVTVNGTEQTVEVEVNLTQTGIEESAATSHIKVYPNPTSDIFWVEADNNIANSTLKIYSINGALVKTKIINGKTQVDIRELNAGMYYIRIQEQTIKIIKE